MGIWAEGSVAAWRAEHIKMEVDNAPSVFMQDILHVDLESQWQRKLYHRRVVDEHNTMLELQGIQTIRSGGSYNGLN